MVFSIHVKYLWYLFGLVLFVLNFVSFSVILAGGWMARKHTAGIFFREIYEVSR